MATAVEYTIVAHVHDNNNWQLPLWLSFLAGASTCVGAAVVFCWTPQQIQGTLSFSLALAGSVMITVSILSLGPELLEGILLPSHANNGNDDEHRDPVQLLVERVASFAVGCIGYCLLSKCAFPEPTDLLLSSTTHTTTGTKSTNNGSASMDEMERQELLSNKEEDNESKKTATPSRDIARMRKTASGLNTPPNARSVIGVTESKLSPKNQEDSQSKTLRSSSSFLSRLGCASMTSLGPPTGEDSSLRTLKEVSYWRVTMLLFVSLLFHNFFEGLAVAASTLESPRLGMTVAVSIAAHNLPEGIAIAVPCLAARPDRPGLAFGLASASGLAEPIGAFLSLFFLSSSSTSFSMELVLSLVAGIMISVALLELYPQAMQHVRDPSNPSTWKSVAVGTVVGCVVMILTEAYS